MQKKYSYLMLALVLSMLWLPLQLMAQDDANTVLQPQFGKQTVTVATGQEITFYDPKGTGSISATSSNNTQSLTVFKPAEAGMSVQITFESFDVKPYNANYPAYVNVYNGEADADNSFTFATTTSEVASNLTLPAGDVLEQLSGTLSSPKTYYSTATDGALSVGFLYRDATKSDGWVAKVKCVKLENMTVTGAGSQYTNVVASPKSKTNVNLAGAYVTASGLLNADHLKTVSFKLTKNEGSMIDPLSLKLYSGSSVSYKGATAIETTVAESNGIYTFSLDKALSDGKNEFTIVGDITGGEVGNKVKVDITGITTTALPDGVNPFTVADAVEVENPAIVMIGSEEQTVDVGDTPLNFYDDGGIDGQIDKNFKSGKITFKPADTDKKVMIDFTKMALATGTIYCQQLHVYNGSEVSADNLLKTFLGTETGKVRSTAADGTLTVVFESNAYNTGDGWEATVSQFTPQPMKVTAIETTQITTGTVCAGDKDQQILKFNIKTEETSPALTTKKFAFTANGTSEQATKAILYYTKATDAFATTTKVGEADVTADAFEITASNEVSLVEGNNFFWLAYDINEMALNGQKIDAAITSATLSDGVHTVENGSPEGDRTVENIILSQKDQGTVTKKVNGSITFKPKSASSYGEYYEGGYDDRINVFVPMHENMVCQIDFSKFNLYYSSYSSDHASLKVYSGNGTTGELLWESTKDTKTTGPGNTLRSTTEDGALTVVFNAGQSSNYSYDGFTATVSEYLSQPMKVTATEVAQSAKSIAGVGEKNVDLLTLNVATTGNKDIKSLSAVTVNLKNSEKIVSKVSLYALTKADDVLAADAEAIASADIDGTANETTLTLAEPKNLSEGNNYFRIRCDISSDAKSGNVVDMAVKSITVGGEAITVESGDPEGAVEIKNIYNLKSGDNGEVLIANNQPLMFYDDGGIDGNYSENFEGTVTFAPKTPGESVKLTFKDFEVTYQDKFNIYDGGEVKETADATYSKYDKPTYFLSNSADGKVTVKFTTKYSNPGFAIEVTAYQKQPITIKSVSTTAIAPATTTKGAETQMLKIAVEAEGDLNQLDIQKFSVASLANVSSVNVYATGTSEQFAPVNLFGQATADKSSVEGSYKISLPGTYYFWLTGNISTDAAENATATASVTSVTGNATETAIGEPLTASATVAKGVSGTITVGAGADYGTIQAAVDALKGGIDGPVVINIKRGIYNENVNVPEIPGTSEKNTVTLQSESGDWHDVKIYYNTYNEPAYSDDKMSAEFGTFTIAGADWFTLRGVEVTTTDQSFPGVIHIKNQSRHVTIDSCYVHTPLTVEYQQDINLIYTYAKNEAYQNNDYLTVKNCLLEGGYIGVRMGGTGTVVLPKEVGGVIENNVIRNQGTKAIYCMDELGAKIRYNRIENDQTTKEFYGFDGQLRDDYNESFEIVGNKFNFNLSTACDPISMRTMKGTAEAPVIVANNEVVVCSDNSGSFGIKLGSASSNVNIAYNTVNINGNAKSAAMYINDLSLENVKILNNIFMNQAGGYAYRYYKAECVALPKYANNVAYTSGDVFAYDKTDIASYDDWKTKSNETDGQNMLVGFYDNEDFLAPVAAGNLQSALPLAYVTKDITGTERNAETPTIGAYEFDAYTDAPVMAEGYPVISNIMDESADLKVKFNQTGIAQFVAKEATETAPTAEEVSASEITLSVYKNEAATATVGGLVKDKEYIIYSVMTGVGGKMSEVYASSKFVAGGEVIKEIPNVKVAAEATESVEAGSNAELKATVSEGTAPFAISWTNGKHEVIATANLDDFGSATSTYAPSECDLYYVTVTDTNGKTASDTCRVAVTGDAVTATFENLYLDENSFWAGPDTKGTPTEGLYGGNDINGSFVSGSYQFSNSFNDQYSSWYGFAYSNRTATDFNTITPDQYNSVVGKGYNDSENFAVAYSSGEIKVLNKPVEGDEIRGFYITNNAYAVNTIAYAKPTDYAHKFEQGDFLKVIFTGHHADGTDAKVEYYLADYRSSKAADHYYLDTWQWVDLRSLGKVTSIDISFDGSDKGGFGVNTPTYFCMDNFNGERIVAEATTQVAGGEVDLKKFFTFDDASATVSYAFADALPEELAQNVSLSADGKLSIKKNFYEKFDVTVSATQKGKIQFVKIPFDIVNGINAVDGENADSNVAARYNIGGQKLNARQRGVNIIRTTTGKMLKVGVR